ncbi:MAG: MotA/TolQ/ExbB proton channel family protein [Deltaproteobacteria bacterium]|jgi:biopolymer transport protein ExbB|nr:MotA/TolQ/ExbB proton channel family protein [Deltaproteobacteria bacterium]
MSLYDLTRESLSALYGKMGPAGAALVLLSLASVYLTVKNITLITLIYKDFRRRFALIESGTKPYSEELHTPGNPLVSIIAEVVEAHAMHSNDIRAEVAYLFHRNFERINRDIAWLKLVSVIAPLLGLMGTMLGMVSVFRELAAGAGGADAAMLANGIWEALLTTILGLAVAIPTLVAFYWLSLKMKGFHIEAIEHSYRAVERFRRNCPHAAAASGAAGPEKEAA